MTNENPLKTGVLVVNSKPLRFNLHQMTNVKEFGGEHLDKGGRINFAEANHALGTTIELKSLTFASSSTNVPYPGQCCGSGPWQKKLCNRLSEYNIWQKLVQNIIKSYKLELVYSLPR